LRKGFRYCHQKRARRGGFPEVRCKVKGGVPPLTRAKLYCAPIVAEGAADVVSVGFGATVMTTAPDLVASFAETATIETCRVVVGVGALKVAVVAV
jgi:hypothetical protein